MTIGREGVGYLFAGCRDIVLFKGIRQNEVIAKFTEAWECDRALRLFLILLDPEEDPEVRSEAADWVEQALLKESLKNFIENQLYSNVLPEEADYDFVFETGSWSTLFQGF